MLTLEKVTLRLGGRLLLENADLRLDAGRRMGLVGRNGTGKTSLLRLIAGELAPDAGEVRLRRGIRIGRIAQEAPGGEVTPLAAVLAADRERSRLLERAARAREASEIAEVHTRLAEIGAEAAPARAARILRGLGFSEEDQGRPLATFSGGWRMRVALASLLFLEPDLLLLDEPTNHLDLEAAAWLEEHLRRYPRTLLLVSHDRDLLNRVPDRICHLEGGRLLVYPGGYDRFLRARAERLLGLARLRERQEAERRRLQAFVDRFRAKATKARQAQSRLKRLARMAPVEEAVRDPEVRFAFPVARVPPPPLVTMEGVAAGYDGRPVLAGLDLRIDPDDRIGLLGANGNGKSTFAALVAGRLAPLAGTLRRARGLAVGFFAQHQIEDLDPDADGISHLARLLPQEPEERLRARLARFGLVQERAETPARHLSGGEKTRLCLARMTVADPQLLILDEPTNHLDIDSREALARALLEFPGAILLVSHDRHLVELVCDRLWLVARGRVTPYEGDLADYRRSLLEERRQERSRRPARPAPPRPRARERRAALVPLRRKAREAERRLEELNAQRRAIETQLADPETYGDGGEVAELRRQLARIESEIAAAEAAWLEAEEAIERLEASGAG